MMGAPLGSRIHDVRERGSSCQEKFLVGPRQILERLWATRGKRQKHRPSLLSDRGRAGEHRRRSLQNDMGIGATKAERIDSCQGRPLRFWPGFQRLRHTQMKLLKRNLRVRRMQM